MCSAIQSFFSEAAVSRKMFPRGKRELACGFPLNGLVVLFFFFSRQQTQIIVQDLTKRNRQLENENAGLQRRVEEVQTENALLRNEKANLEQEVQRLRVANAELTERNDNLQRENKTLSGRSSISRVDLDARFFLEVNNLSGMLTILLLLLFVWWPSSNVCHHFVGQQTNCARRTRL